MTAPTGRALEPIDRISEVLFGLIMVLTFTGSISAAEAGRAEIRTMMLGAIGCNLAWGLIDAIMYLMARVHDRGQGLQTVRAVREAASPEAGRRAIAEALPPMVAAALPEAGLEAVRQQFLDLPEPPRRPTPTWHDGRGALGVFLLVFLCTLPAILPFVVMDDAMRALRVSNAIAVGLLFVTGYSFGKYSGLRPWPTGLAMVLLGAALVGLTMALGG